MKNAQPLLFLGDKRRDALIARVVALVRRWREAWAPGSGDTFEAQCEPPTAGGFSAPVASVATSCWAIELAGERIAVLLLPHATFAWCVQQAGASALDTGGDAAPDSLAERLEREVAETLLAELSAGAREPLTATRLSPDSLAEWSQRMRAWTFQVKSAGTARALTLLLAASRVEMLAPARAPARAGTLEPRRKAVGANSVVLRAVVGETSMSVSDLADLALDDVLLLDQHLVEPVTLVSRASGIPVAAGNLGRSDARRAIKVAGIPTHKN